MNNVQVIYTQEIIGRTFQIYGTIDNPLFLAKDVASWIEHSDVSTMVRSVDDNEKLVQTLFVAGQNREVTFLTEDGLFEVLMLSRKPNGEVCINIKTLVYQKGVECIRKLLREESI